MSLNFNQIKTIENITKVKEIVEDINHPTENCKTSDNININNENLNNTIDDDCGICGSALLEDVVKLKCNHMYHYECISLAYKFSHSKLCPYCRKPSNIPLSKDHIKPVGTCEGILKTGKRKGEKCGCSIFKNDLSLKLCKRHFNVELKKNEKNKNN